MNDTRGRARNMKKRRLNLRGARNEDRRQKRKGYVKGKEEKELEESNGQRSLVSS